MSEPNDDGEGEEPEKPTESAAPDDALRMAEKSHRKLSEMKTWSLEAARGHEKQAHALIEKNEIGSEEFKEMREQANYIRSVYRRIEHGDSNVAQVNSEF